MALVKWSALVSEIRGKLNGTVFARNRFGAYARNKVTPYNPSTPAQQHVRQQFAYLSALWRQLTPEQITAWNNAVGEYLSTNIFGDTIRHSGINLFIRLNTNLLNINKSILTFPPAPAPVNRIDIYNIGINPSVDKIVVFIHSDTSISHAPLLYVTRPLSPGISFVKSEYRLIEATYQPISGEPQNYSLAFGPEYVSRYGSLTNFPGQQIFMKVIPIDIKTGLNGNNAISQIDIP